MANGAHGSTPDRAKAWDLVMPQELAFKFPRLTAPLRQMPELTEEPPRRRWRVVEAVLRWLDEQF